MNTIIYIRTSTEEQNPQNQLNDCKSVCNRLGIKEFEIQEEKKSAYKEDSKREMFNDILRRIKKQEISNFIVWDLDRIYRNRKNLLSFFKLCHTFKCNVYSFRQDWLETIKKMPSPFDEMVFDMMLQIMGWIAEDESKKKSERIKIAIRKNEGVTLSYKGNRWGRPSLSKKVEDEVRKLHEEGKTYSEISKIVYYWNKNGNKKFISPSKICHIINGRKQKMKGGNKNG